MVLPEDVVQAFIPVDRRVVCSSQHNDLCQPDEDKWGPQTNNVKGHVVGVSAVHQEKSCGRPCGES